MGQGNETMSQFRDSLMAQYNEGKEHKLNRAIKIFDFENTRSDVKVLQSLRKKEINMSDKSYIDQPEEYTYKS